VRFHGKFELIDFVKETGLQRFLPYQGGFGYILSADLVHHVATQNVKWRWHKFEDVALGSVKL
jgi:hypothetical protein